MHTKMKYFTLSALFIALGILIPFIFHGLLLGPVFLPMFWPVALAPFFLSLPFALAVALLTPIVSFLFTGMPPISPPVLPVMIFELLFLAGTISILYTRSRLGTFWLVLASLLISRIMLFISAGLMAPYVGLPPKMVSLFYLIKNFPGIMIILIFIPLLVYRLKHESVFTNRSPHVQTTP